MTPAPAEPSPTCERCGDRLRPWEPPLCAACARLSRKPELALTSLWLLSRIVFGLVALTAALLGLALAVGLGGDPLPALAWLLGQLWPWLAAALGLELAVVAALRRGWERSAPWLAATLLLSSTLAWPGLVLLALARLGSLL